jgi:hypothetical protein
VLPSNTSQYESLIQKQGLVIRAESRRTLRFAILTAASALLADLTDDASLAEKEYQLPPCLHNLRIRNNIVSVVISIGLSKQRNV